MEKSAPKAAEQPAGSIRREPKQAEAPEPLHAPARTVGAARAQPRRMAPAGGAASAPPPGQHPVLKLQQTIGNRAVGRLLRPPRLQLKQRVRRPADVYEREADQAADAVTMGGVLDPALAAALSLRRLEGAPKLVRRSPDDSEAPESPSPAEPLAAPLIVNDEVEQPGPGQMSRSEFLARLETAVCRMVIDALAGSGRSSKDCPYLDYWFAWAQQRTSTQIERAIRLFVPEAMGVRKALDYIPLISARIRRSIAVWLKTGKVTGVPKEAAGPPPGSAVAASPRGAVQTKARPEGARAADPEVIQAQLGSGTPLAGTVQSRMQSAFGYDFTRVRVHTDRKAAQLAEELNARAFTIGGDVAFARGEFQPGTTVGDALIAHELAHVVQQGADAGPSTLARWGGTESPALESDANAAAAGAVASWWGKGQGLWGDLAQNAGPRLRSGLRLQRCADHIDPKLLPPPPKYEDVIKNLKGLYKQKQQILAGQANTAELETVNAQIDAEMKNLRLLGITLDEDAIFERVLADKELRVIEASVERIPATPAYFGQRLNFILHTSYLPPERNARIEWRWKAKKNEYQFFMTQARGFSFTLEEGFWTMMTPQEIKDAQGFEVLARIYLGDDKNSSATATTGWIALQNTIPPKLEIDASQAIAVPGAQVKFKFKDWAPPDQATFAIDWDADGKRVAEDFFVLTRSFSTTGTKKITATLYRVKRNIGIRDKQFLQSVDTTIEIQDPVTVGTTVLSESAKLGAPPALSAMDESIHSSMREIAAHAALGGERKAYWEERYSAQEKQLKQIGEQVPDFKQTLDLPKDPTTLAAGSYATPIPAVVVYPSHDGVQPVKLYLVVRGDGTNWTAYLIDITGAKVLKFPETSSSKPLQAISGAFENWKSENPYHTGGTVVYSFNPPGWKLANNFSTFAYGKRTWEYIDGILQVGGIVVGALLIAAPSDPLTKLLGFAILALSIAASGHAIYRNLKLGGKWLDKENIIEGLSILTALLGIGGGWLRSLGAQVRNVRPWMFRLGNMAIIASVAGDLGTVVYASEEALAQLRAVQGDPTLDDAQRSAELTRVISGLFLNLALVIASNKELFKGGFAKGDFVKERIGEGDVKLAQGTRLDLELELKKQGADPAELRKLPDSELVGQHFKIQQRLKANATLAKVKEKLTGAALAEFEHMAAEFDRPEDFAAALEGQSDPEAFLKGRASERKAAAEKKAADEKKSADEKAAEDKKKTTPPIPPPVVTRSKHAEWIEKLKKLDPASDVQLAPARAVGPGAEGAVQVAPENQIRINDGIDIHPDRLAEISEENLKKMLTATRELKAKGGNFELLDKTHQDALNSLASTGNYRLRFEFHRQRAQKFLVELGVADKPIFQNMSDAERNRLYELTSKVAKPDPSKSLVSQLAPKGAGELPRQAADYALSRKPASVPEFVNHYEFYLTQFEKQAELRIAQFDKKVATAISAEQAKSGTPLTDSQKSKIRAKVTKEEGVTGKDKDFYFAEQQKQMQAAGTPGATSEEARRSVGAVYDQLVKEIGGRVGGTRIDPGLPADQVIQKLRAMPDIQFGSESAGAYHTEKHYDAVPNSERTGNRYEDYIKSARKTIQDPASAVSHSSTQEGGARTYVFTKTAGGETGRAIVIVTSDGRVILATYM